ncbi:MAG TPA: hypothetical protein VFH51_16045, partial [Myxococcota bacterium]|nr:hypothetical protein [Myxococcota bacterium]
IVPDVAPVRGKLAKLADEVEVKVDEGDNQRIKSGGVPARPLTARATLRGAPLAGLPIAFDLPGGKVDPVAVTDAQGIASARVTSVGDAAHESRVTATVDWAGIAGLNPAPAWTKTLRTINLAYRIVPSTLAATRVIVKVIERIEDAPNITVSALQPVVSTSFTSQGFGVQDGEALTTRVPPAQLLTLDPKVFQKEARDLADVAVVGEAVSSYSSTLSGEVVVHRARLTLRAVDLGSGEVIATTSLEQKGQPGKGPEKAGRKALEALAKAFTAEFCKSVKDKLGF